MRIQVSGDFDSSCDEVFALLSDDAFQTSMATTPGSSASVTTNGDRTVITSVRVFPTSGLPDFARTFVGDSLTLTEIQDWGPAGADGSRTGIATLTVEGAPLRLDGKLALAPVGTGAQLSVNGDLRARIPLVGGKVEASAAPAIEEGIRLEYDLMRQRLSS